MSNQLFSKRNEVLQFGMNHQDELNGILYMKKPIKSGTVEVYGISILGGELMGVDSDGSETTVTYFEFGPENLKTAIDDLHKKYCN